MNKQRALGSLYQLLDLEYGANKYEVLITNDNRCYVYLYNEVLEYSKVLEFLIRQSRRNLIREGILNW